jgi:hypothetical protein
MVVEVQHRSEFRGEVRVGGRLPRLRRLPRHPALTQDPAISTTIARRSFTGSLAVRVIRCSF